MHEPEPAALWLVGFDGAALPASLKALASKAGMRRATVGDFTEAERPPQRNPAIVVSSGSLDADALSDLEVSRRRTDDRGAPIPFYLLRESQFQAPTLTAKRGGRAKPADGGTQNAPPGYEKEWKDIAEALGKTVDGPILLEGETGTGKTELSRWLHQEHFKRQGRFQVVNCATLDLEAASFSTKFRGVDGNRFTGVKERQSIFEDVADGTLLLDEFQELTTRHQAMLLDLIQPFSTVVESWTEGEGRYWRVDVQVLVALNKPVAELLATEKLRPDIYHRLWRRASLPTVRGTLSRANDSSQAANGLRWKLIAAQESALSFWREGQDVGEAIARALPFLYLNGRLWRQPTLPIWETTPIPENLLHHQWKGNWREVHALARVLLQRNEKVGTWNRDGVKYALDTLTARQSAEVEPGSPAREDRSPAQCMRDAWVAAMATARHVAQLADLLGLDERTAKGRLKALDAGEFDDLRFMEKLQDSERKDLGARAREFLSTRSRRKRNEADPVWQIGSSIEFAGETERVLGHEGPR